MRRTLSAPVDGTSLVGIAMAALLAAAFVGALLMPPLFWLLPPSLAAAVLALLCFRRTIACTRLWLLVVAATLEMTMHDLLGQAAFQVTIAVVKATGIGLAAVAVLRYGPRLDWFNPAFAWLAMFAGGMAHGLWPGLSATDSLRSLVGSVAPFAFGFSRLSRDWAQAIIRTIAWCPILILAAAAIPAVAGLRPLFINSGGLRLAGLGHPAFLAAVCQTAIYACLIELYRNGRRRDLLLLLANFLLLLLTGARAPFTYALVVTGMTLLLAHAPAFPPRQRLLLILVCASILPVAAVLLLGLLPGGLSAVRAFNVLTTNLGNLSGRQLLWPNFAEAAAASPWLGWGVGAGNLIIPQDDPVARLLQTWAAHNEYLRIEVEGGQLGRALLILLLVLWVRQHTAPLCRSDRTVMRLVFVAFAAHALTDNLLISTPACVFFTFAIAVFARGAWEAQDLREKRRLLHAAPRA